MVSTNPQKKSGYVAELDQAERASRDEITALQTKRLAWTLAHAYDNVAHYKKAFDKAGVSPRDFRQLSDLKNFPFTVKTDLRDNYPFNMFAVPREKLVRVHASSGTTGKPIVVGYTRADIETWSEVMARSIRAAGGRSGMIIHNAYGYGLFTGGLGVHYGAEKLGCTVVPISGGMTDRQVQLINDFRPEIITVTPSYMLAILDEFNRRGIDPRLSSLKVGIFGAEPWTNAMRAEIEAAFDMDATDIYGLSEVMGPGVAQECIETKDGLHIWEDHFYPEVIDPDTGAVLPDGEKGELVFTSLTKEAFPVIRYRTRDLTRLLPGTARPGMRRMEKVTGRSDDMIILRGVNVFPTQIEEALLTTEWCGGHFVTRTFARRADGRDDGAGGSAPRKLGRQRSHRIHRPRHRPHQEHHRHLAARQGGGAGNAGALARQGQARHRQAAEVVTPSIIPVRALARTYFASPAAAGTQAPPMVREWPRSSAIDISSTVTRTS
jgi:phenylacetate-CoA ligase